MRAHIKQHLVRSIIIGVLLVGAVFTLAFTDVSTTHPYKTAIDALSSAHIIDGYPDGSFKPSALVTRQQFAKMIDLTLGVSVTEDDVCSFGDVDVSGPGNLYPDNYVAAAAREGITTGVTLSLFKPWDNITRAQVMTMVVRAAASHGVTLDNPTPDYFAGTSSGSHIFSTFNQAPHGPNAQKAEFNGLLWGVVLDQGGGWDAWKNATRGEVAQILWRLRQKIDAVSPTTTVPASTTTTTLGLRPPVLLSPADGTVFDHYPRTTTLKWQGVPAAVEYLV
ncbi:MAG: S-layer homology domain-containing protein, partial [Actinobacteria bacterium]|nr:S-layer homology domain-containing protein [Actinomycetota bacterium]